MKYKNVFKNNSILNNKKHKIEQDKKRLYLIRNTRCIKVFDTTGGILCR